MSTLTAILEPDAEGTLHLTLPKDWKFRKIKVTATPDVSADETLEAKPAFKVGCLKGFTTSSDFDDPLEDFREYIE
jgi:Protein of unknown function (DUF2281)